MTKIKTSEVLKMLGDGMTQSEIAHALKVTQPAISLKVKRVKTCPSCGEILND